MSAQLYPWETPTAPASPLWGCCTSSIGPLCQHGPTLYGPAHFAPVRVSQLRPGMVADFETVMTGEVRYRRITEASLLLGTVYTVAFDDTVSRPMHAIDEVRVAQADAVTRRRIAETGPGMMPALTVRPWVYGQPEVVRRVPVNPEVFASSAPRWNCVDYPNDGMHLLNRSGGCSWCGMTRDEIKAERANAECREHVGSKCGGYKCPNCGIESPRPFECECGAGTANHVLIIADAT